MTGVPLTPYLIPLEAAPKRQDIGAKAWQLSWLQRHGYRVPQTHILTFEAHQAYRRDRQAFLMQLGEGLAAKLDLGRQYAVRSSASLEDQGDYSFAGQFTSLLAIQGQEALLEAIGEVFDSAAAPTVQAYLKKSGKPAEALEIAVLLQEMVAAECSGVAFSRNPLTGLNEVVIEGSRGTGEAVLQTGLTPERWVYKWGGWLTQPEDPALRESLLEEIATTTRMIAESSGKPVDLEWAYDGANLYWVQMRPITGVNDLRVYSNRISREVLPGIIKPLVWSINTPMVNRAWIDLFTELIGPNDIQPEELAKAFYYRAYFNMATIGRIFELLGLPADSLELLMGLEGGAERPKFRPSRQILAYLPRMLRFALKKLRFEGRLRTDLPDLELRFQAFAAERLDHLDETELVARAESLIELTYQAAYFNIVIPVLMSVYSALFTRQLGKLGVDFARFDLTAGVGAFDDYDPKPHLAELNRRFQALDGPTQQQARSSRYASLADLAGLESFVPQLHDFVARFGHLSDSGNDFSVAPWGEDPDHVLQLVIQFHTPELAQEKITWSNLPVPAWRRIALRPLYRRAQSFRLHREAISSLYTYGYGLFRRHFLALAERLVARGLLDREDDIFYLYFDEIRAIAGREVNRDIKSQVKSRRQELEASRNVILPEIIYGDQPPPIESPGEIAERLVGIPTSRGYYRGPANVVRSTADFNKLNLGDVLVIPYSDVAWTPLFAKAGAVVAEAGGVLSHSSIVAREYAIPCVVSVEGACRIPDGSLLMVDGFKGEIQVSPHPGESGVATAPDPAVEG